MLEVNDKYNLSNNYINQKMTSESVAQNMTKFLNVQAKTTNVDDLRLDALIKQGKQGQIVIVGCPFDQVRKRCINKGGQQNGPCCLRRFFYKVGPLFNTEYQINISEVKISDYGNVHPSVQQNANPQKIINRIQQQIFALINNNKFPFVFGGSKESALGSARAFHKKYTNGKHLLIAGMPFLKRPFDNDKLTSDSLMAVLSNQFPKKQILFGPHQKYFPLSYNNNFQYISYNQIYDFEDSNMQKQLGFMSKPVRKLTSLVQANTPYHVTLSVDAIERFNGCRDLPLHGIKPDQMIEIFYWLGQHNQIKSIDITQFNPSCQDYQSSLIILNLLYYFLMGWTKRVV